MRLLTRGFPFAGRRPGFARIERPSDGRAAMRRCAPNRVDAGLDGGPDAGALGAIVFLGLRLGTGWPEPGVALPGTQPGRTRSSPSCALSGRPAEHDRVVRAQEPDAQPPSLDPEERRGPHLRWGRPRSQRMPRRPRAGGDERVANPAPAPEPESLPAQDSPAPADRLPELDSAVPRRIRVQTESGRVVAARVHGTYGDKVSVLLPDGQLGFPPRAAGLYRRTVPPRDGRRDEPGAARGAVRGLSRPAVGSLPGACINRRRPSPTPASSCSKTSTRD